MLKCCINIPDNTFWAITLERKWAHKEKDKNMFMGTGAYYESGLCDLEHKKMSLANYHLTCTRRQDGSQTFSNSASTWTPNVRPAVKHRGLSEPPRGSLRTAVAWRRWFPMSSGVTVWLKTTRCKYSATLRVLVTFDSKKLLKDAMASLKESIVTSWLLMKLVNARTRTRNGSHISSVAPSDLWA